MCFAVPGESAERNNRNRILRKRSFLHIADDRSSRLYTKERIAEALWALQIAGSCMARFLYYVPLLVLASGNLWNGFAVNYSPTETVCRIVCMLCVGFLEEVIFRGLLFASIAKDNVKSAIIISSVTFGIGHIINLFNGSGMGLVSNLCQIVFAVAVGFMLVTIFYRGGSMLPCIIVHSAINTLGTFANDADVAMQGQLIHIAVLIAITVAYTLILIKTLPKKQLANAAENK